MAYTHGPGARMVNISTCKEVYIYERTHIGMNASSSRVEHQRDARAGVLHQQSSVSPLTTKARTDVL